MSELCLINIKKHNLTFNQLKEFAKEMVCFALKNDKGVYFNSISCCNSLVREAKLCDYFLLTDSFYCDNSEFLTTIDLFDGDVNTFKERFLEKFKFFEYLFELIFKNNISTLEVYLSEGVGDHLSDYDEVITTPQNFLSDVFEQILKYKEEMAYEIPNLKMVINKFE